VCLVEVSVPRGWRNRLFIPYSKVFARLNVYIWVNSRFERVEWYLFTLDSNFFDRLNVWIWLSSQFLKGGMLGLSHLILIIFARLNICVWLRFRFQEGRGIGSSHMFSKSLLG
jgi:hypothetical protein